MIYFALFVWMFVCLFVCFFVCQWIIQFVLFDVQVTERPQAENDDIQQENAGQTIGGTQQGELNDRQQQHDGGQQEQEDPSLLPGDLERLLQDVDDGEFDPEMQQVLVVQHQAGMGQGQLNTQQFQDRFFVQ